MYIDWTTTEKEKLWTFIHYVVQFWASDSGKLHVENNSTKLSNYR